MDRDYSPIDHELGRQPSEIYLSLFHEKQEGTKFDTGKNRLELIPPEAINALGEVLTFGAEKYDDRNWEKGMNYSRVYGAALRHMNAWNMKENTDPETGYSHLAHALCCISFLLTYEARSMTQFDDRSTL